MPEIGISADIEAVKSDISGLVGIFGEIGKDESGGVTRLVFTEAWLSAQKRLKLLFERCGLSAEFDDAGNLHGVLRGQTGETVATGSHVDTVRRGGPLDGQYGILAGALALKYLSEKAGIPKKSLEVIAFAEEEGCRFPFAFWGSKNFVGAVDAKEVYGLTDRDGVRFEDAIKSAGFGAEAGKAAARDDVAAFVELHIEQGAVLDSEKCPIGIVGSIVAQKRLLITVGGEANHAGTTPMRMRKDAVRAACALIDALYRSAEGFDDELVFTVGMIDVKPNAANVIASDVTFSVDMRHPDTGKLSELESIVYREAEKLRGGAVVVEISKNMDNPAVPMSQKIIDTIIAVCEQNATQYRLMHSGAGHDSQIIAEKTDTGMIFVPSRGGVSHSPEEYTDPEYLAQGVLTLMRVLHRLAYSD